jgi:adenosylhomocysteine nucleosidase
LKSLGIVVATTAEAWSLTKHPVASSGTLLQISGVGAKRARLAARTLLEKGATSLLSWGSASGLIPELSPGSLVLPKNIIAVGGSLYPVDATWRVNVYAQLKEKVNLHEGSLAESITVLTHAAEKATLFKQTGAIAVDMESAAVAAEAQRAGVPFMAIRAVVDPADMTLPPCALASLSEFGKLRPLRLLKALAKSPVELFALFRLGRNFHAAQSTLSIVARLAGSNLFISERVTAL